MSAIIINRDKINVSCPLNLTDVTTLYSHEELTEKYNPVIAIYLARKLG